MSSIKRGTEFGLAALRVGGADADSFLQSQLTGDIASVDAEAFRVTAWCNPKGRVLAVGLLRRRDGEFDLLLPAPIAGEVLGKLSMFRIGREVEISPGGSARIAAPGEPGATPLNLDPSRALAVDGDVDTAPPLPEQWLRDDIEVRIPWILEATRGEFLPQMLGLERLGGLSYRKGCYPGQEVIARVHYRGKLTQRAARFEAEGAAQPGAALTSEAGRGTVLYATPAGRGGFRGLAVVPAAAVAGAECRLDAGKAVLVD